MVAFLAEMATCCFKPAVTSADCQSLFDSKNILVRIVFRICETCPYDV